MKSGFMIHTRPSRDTSAQVRADLIDPNIVAANQVKCIKGFGETGTAKGRFTILGPVVLRSEPLL